MNLNDLIETLKREGRWLPFEACFKKMRQDIVNEFSDGNIKTEIDLSKAYAQMDILDKIINIENYVRKWGGQ